MVLAGCGSSQHAASLARRDVSQNRTCGATKARGFRTCIGDPSPLRSTIERWNGSSWDVVTGPLPHADPDARWGEVFLSPDRRTLLADWRYPCDSGAVLFLPVEEGQPRTVTGEKDWRKAPQAQALGWTREGKARVRIYTVWRGHHPPPSGWTYLFDPDAPAADAHPAPLKGC
jgi:hypothetical protein